jgi:hypothetical protein
VHIKSYQSTFVLRHDIAPLNNSPAKLATSSGG